MKKLSLLATSLALALGSTASYASIISVNPDNLGSDPIINVGALDWNAGNALSVADTNQSLGAGQAFVGQHFTTYAHASLGNFNNALGNPIGGLDLNSEYEWTFVAGYRETMTLVTASSGAGTTAFVVDTTARSNFFHVYYDDTPDANNLTGKGFNDGELILTAQFLPATPGFFNVPLLVDTNNDLIPDSPSIDNLDKFGANDYSDSDGAGPKKDYKSLVGNGSVPLTLAVTYANPSFFLVAPTALNFKIFATTEEKLPFQQQNPSSCFWNGSAYISGAGNGITGGCGAAGDGGSIGLVNGISGPNVMFQTDGTASFEVPEPGSLGLLGLGMVGLGFLGRRRKA